jgi:hypothetical protein
MQELFLRKLHDYLRDNNLDLFIDLQMTGKLAAYLKDKVSSTDGLFNELLAEGRPVYLIEEMCMGHLTADLRPSRYLYVRESVEEDFKEVEEQWKKAGVFEFEIINLTEECKTVFEHYGFSQDNMEDKAIKLAVIGTIQEYLQKQLVSVNL